MEQSYVCKLRVMTEKSILGFGYSNIKDLRIREIINIGLHGRLIDIYFKLDKCSFEDTLLDELGITEELRIAKPGKLPYDEADKLIKLALNNYYKDKDKLSEWQKANSTIKFNKKHTNVTFNIASGKSWSKYSDTNYNHGHKQI